MLVAVFLFMVVSVCEHGMCECLCCYFSKVLPLKGVSLCVHYTECCYFTPHSMSPKVLRVSMNLCVHTHTQKFTHRWSGDHAPLS